MSFHFLKTKKFWLITILVLLVVWIGYGCYKKKNAPVKYDTVKVERGNLAQTVEATGKIQSSNDLELRFEAAGTLESVKVKEGDKVTAGQVLATLKAAELNAMVAQAQASLNQKIAGADDNDRAFYKAAVDSSMADWNKTKSDIANSIANYQAAAETAKTNLKLAEGGDNSQIVSQAYDNVVATLQLSLSKIDDALTQADNILGIDNLAANDSFEDYLSVLDSSKLTQAKNYYRDAKDGRLAARNVIMSLNTNSSHTAVDSAIITTKNTLEKISTLLLGVSEVLTASSQSGNFTQAVLDAKKTTIDATRSGVNAQYSAVIGSEQSIVNAKNSYTTYKIAYDRAVSDLQNVQSTAASVVAIKEALYNQALANYNNKIQPTREVDLAPLRAALAQAVANRDKAILKAPIDGVVAKVNKKVGEMVSSAEAPVELISPHYEIEVDIPETDVAKLALNNSSTITLDAFGDDIKFAGKIISIDPASTEIQDVVYYKVKVAIDETDKQIKPGMTANVTVATALRENTLFAPSRSILTNDKGKYVRLLKNGQSVETPVKVGLKGDDGKTEILEGVNEGEEVILSTSETK